MSILEDELHQQIQLAGLPLPEREYKFCEGRRWAFDMAWPEDPTNDGSFAVEVEGGTRGKSRHTSGDGFQKDTEKYNTAALERWIVLRVTSQDVKDGTALGWIESYFRGTPYPWRKR